MEEYESEEEALTRASKLLGIALEKIKLTEPKTILYEFPINKVLRVYQVNENLSLGIGFTRHHQGKNFYGLWLIEGEKIERI
ncbi:MAG: hypothetical protein NZ942_01000 [Candidatus Aenigmarchaeota archaeon]|nr:hypothetical protein [Candidatus Aenigmarchaeota archaeon]